MTDPADRFLEEQFLEGELHALARGVPVPVVPSEDDVRRGRRRLLRMRLAMASGTTATLAAVLGVTSLTAGAPKATEIAPASHLPSAPPATPSTTPSVGGEGTGSPSGHRGGGNEVPVGGSAGGSGPGAAGGLVPPNHSPVKHAQTQAAATGAVPGHHPTWPATNPSDLPTSTPIQLPSEDPTGSATGPATDLPTPTAPTTDPTPPEPTPTGGTKIRLDRVLGVFNAVLAEHLDADRDHLQPYDRRVDPKVTRKADGLLFALGSTYRWEDGRSRSTLGVTVASGWDQVDWDCGATYADWTCHPADSGIGAEVATHDGVRQVAVEHDSGQVVVITADPAYDLAEAALVAAASDDRLALPGAAPQAPPSIDSAAFASAGEAVLLTEEQSFVQTTLDRSPLVRGTWSAEGSEGGTLGWSARPIYSGGTFACLATYLKCYSMVVDEAGTTVQVALLKKQAGWLVRYDGPSYAVRVWSSDRTFPKKRASAFVTDDAWQPTR
jgi:hypothetical protein